MKTISFLSTLLIALVLVFSACKKDEETKSDTKEKTEETTEEEENTEEENTGSYTKAQLTGSWSLQNATAEDLCGGKSEVYTFKDGDNNAYLSCDNDPDPFVFPYTLSGDKLTMDMDFLGKPTFTINKLDATTLKMTSNGYAYTFLKK